MGELRSDGECALVVARLVSGVEVPAEEVEALWEPWQGIARAVLDANGKGRVNAFREVCAQVEGGARLERLVLAQNPRAKRPRRGLSVGMVPALPKAARTPLPTSPSGLGEGKTPGGWLDVYVRYAREVSPLTPDLFHLAGGLWLVSLAVARRLVLRLAHKDVYPNLAVLQVAPTTLYAKSTGLGIPRFLASTVMRHLLLPGEMTPEAMIDELAGREPAMFTGIDVQEWQHGKDYAGQRGVCLDEASSLFVGMSKDYNVGMGETLLRLYDCDPYISRQTRGTGRASVRDAYWTFLGATTPWHLKKADVETLWHAGIWPRFLLLTPEGPPRWERPRKTRAELPMEVVARLQRLVGEDLPESKYGEATRPVDVGLGTGVFGAWERYSQAMLHDMLLPPSPVDVRLYGVYGRLPEQALKIGMLLAALDWDGNGAPVMGMGHWARGQGFAERCRESAHRLPGLLAEQSQSEAENKVLACLGGQEGMVPARKIYRALNMRSGEVKTILMDLEEAGLVASTHQGKTIVYRTVREDEDLS